MARRPADDPDDDPDDEDETPEPSRSRRSSARSGRPRTTRRPPVRRWRPTEDDPDDSPVDADEAVPEDTPKRSQRAKPPTYWRARDSLWFEPLVALAVIVVLLVSLYAYTGNWPPVYVVESDSMQHGYTDIVGLINTGDLVLAQKIPANQITDYVMGMKTGYSTYGEYGDVLLYHPNGAGSTPIIHRAILYLVWNPAYGTYSAPELQGLPCGASPTAFYKTPGTAGECGTTNLTSLNLTHIGWKSVPVVIDLQSSMLGDHSGYLTMGDNNFDPTGCVPSTVACTGFPDQLPGGFSSLVEPGWIIGVARGMVPWFGAFKLLLDGNAGMVPPQSWEFAGLTIAGIILVAFGLHYALRAEGIESPIRKREEEEEAEEEEDDREGEPEGGGSRGRRILRSLTPWRHPDETDDEEAPPHSRSTADRSAAARRGRPRPQVRRTKGRPTDDDADDDL